MKISTFGQRLKHARLSAKQTQEQLAQAISDISETRTKKGLVSQWENDKIGNPQNATVFAMQTATGFAVQWLVSGKGPKLASAESLQEASPSASYGRLDRVIVFRSIIIAAGEQTTPEGIAYAAIEVAETLSEEPNTPDSTLKRIARLV